MQLGPRARTPHHRRYHFHRANNRHSPKIAQRHDFHHASHPIRATMSTKSFKWRRNEEKCAAPNGRQPALVRFLTPLERFKSPELYSCFLHMHKPQVSRDHTPGYTYICAQMQQNGKNEPQRWDEACKKRLHLGPPRYHISPFYYNCGDTTYPPVQ